MDSHLRICIFDEGEAAGAIVSCLFIVIPATPSLTWAWSISSRDLQLNPWLRKAEADNHPQNPSFNGKLQNECNNEV